MTFNALFFVAALATATPQGSPEVRTVEPEKSTLYRAMGFAMVGTAASDLWSTERFLRDGNRELNPLGRTNFPGRLALKSGGTAAVWYWSDQVHRDGHTRTALWMRIITVAAWGYATAHNLRDP